MNTTEKLQAANNAQEMLEAVQEFGYVGCEDGLYIPCINCTVHMTNADIAEYLGLDTDDAEEICEAYEEHEEEVDAHFLFEHKDDIVEAATSAEWLITIEDYTEGQGITFPKLHDALNEERTGSLEEAIERAKEMIAGDMYQEASVAIYRDERGDYENVAVVTTVPEYIEKRAHEPILNPRKKDNFEQLRAEYEALEDDDETAGVPRVCKCY